MVILLIIFLIIISPYLLMVAGMIFGALWLGCVAPILRFLTRNWYDRNEGKCIQPREWK